MSNHKLIAVAIIVFFAFSAYPLQPAHAANFTLILSAPTMNDRWEFMAKAIKSYLEPLLVDVKLLFDPSVVYTSGLVADTKAWDLALVTISNPNLEYPALMDRYSSHSVLSNKLYGFYHADIMARSGINVSTMQSLLDDITYEQDPSQRILQYNEFQRKFNEEWLWEIPILSNSRSEIIYTAFDGYNPVEGVLQSIYLGAHWSSNPTRREGVSTSTFTSAIFDNSGGINPIVRTDSDMWKINQYLYPSLFLQDEFSNLHPNLVSRYLQSSSGTTATWDLYLRDDVHWRNSDGSEGPLVSAKDVKFTMDMLRFNWTSFASNEVYSQMSNVQIVNDTYLQITIDKQSPIDVTHFGLQSLVPEYVLNGTLHKDTQELGELYKERYNPTSSDEWQNFFYFPTTAGPYYLSEYDPTKIVLKADERFVFPTEADYPNFNLGTPEIEAPYYFAYADNPETSVFEKPSALGITTRNIMWVEQFSTQYLLLLGGGIDIVDYSNQAQPSTLDSDPDFSIYNTETPDSGDMLLLNLQNPKLQDYNVRKAIAHVINKQELENIFQKGQQEQESVISPYFTSFYTTAYAIPFDITAAQQLFKEKGYAVLNTNGRSNPLPGFTFALALLPLVIFRKKNTSHN